MQTRQIPLTQLIPFQNKKTVLSNEDIDMLVQDILDKGIKKPLVVRPAGDMYEVIHGMRRWNAAVIANLQTVPANILDLSDREAEELQGCENLHRFDTYDAARPDLDDDEMSDAELEASIEESRLRVAELSIEETPVFALREPLPPELCELFRNDFQREEMIQNVLLLTPKADPAVCNEHFDRFTAGLNAGELHLEGHRYAINESLLSYIEAYLDGDAIMNVFPKGQWEQMTSERQAALIDAASRIHTRLTKIITQPRK
jgi:ParB/RepB/Spo0J family partition protein